MTAVANMLEGLHFALEVEEEVQSRKWKRKSWLGPFYMLAFC